MRVFVKGCVTRGKPDFVRWNLGGIHLRRRYVRRDYRGGGTAGVLKLIYLKGILANETDKKRSFVIRQKIFLLWNDDHQTMKRPTLNCAETVLGMGWTQSEAEEGGSILLRGF